MGRRKSRLKEMVSFVSNTRTDTPTLAGIFPAIAAISARNDCWAKAGIANWVITAPMRLISIDFPFFIMITISNFCSISFQEIFLILSSLIYTPTKYLKLLQAKNGNIYLDHGEQTLVATT
ncbi:hypothetical protein [Chitinophaga dinghuensis]|uniref:hypothetical protein n=1 Tax=Chitinophaga dinghuensis TaxID=1539050 RepID=UPI001FE28DE0|nr:hypothetical protein [Chitinophaga dinghuensis]